MNSSTGPSAGATSPKRTVPACSWPNSSDTGDPPFRAEALRPARDGPRAGLLAPALVRGRPVRLLDAPDHDVRDRCAARTRRALGGGDTPGPVTGDTVGGRPRRPVRRTWRAGGGPRGCRSLLGPLSRQGGRRHPHRRGRRTASARRPRPAPVPRRDPRPASPGRRGGRTRPAAGRGAHGGPDARPHLLRARAARPRPAPRPREAGGPEGWPGRARRLRRGGRSGPAPGRGPRPARPRSLSTDVLAEHLGPGA